jgi:uncharacterized protein (TIGR02145 family)/uncharacterized repeat protein (TIGR02543 family)
MKAYLLMLSAVAVAFIGMGCGNNKGGQPVAPTAEYTLAIELMPIGSGSVDREPNKLTYKAGDSVTVTAKPKDGYAFSHWSGVLNSENDTITLVMNGNLTLTANFVDKPIPPTPKTYTLKITATNGGSVSPAVGTHTYDAETEVAVIATADAGYTFSDWIGASSSTDAAITVKMDGDKVLTANFQEDVTPPPDKFALTISATVGGSVSPAVGTHFYDEDTPVTVTAAADAGYTFVNWIGASSSTDTAITITMDGNKILTANFEEDVPPPPETYTLTIAATNGGSVSPAVGAHSYEAGASVTVTATADAGYTFVNWGGASSSASAAVTITMDGNKTLTANFEENVPPPPDTYTLTIAATVGGSVSPAVGEHFYEVGASVTVTAAADSGYTFDKWSGASSSTDTAITVKMDGDKTLTANFLKDVPPPTDGTFIDGRDEKTYRWVEIGTQKWMAENLNYAAEGSKCYDNKPDSCEKYGRLYDWETAMNGASSSSANPSGVQGVCPVGWHLPSDAEWTTLTDFVGGESTAGTKLKSATDWQSYSGVPVGTDQYGFSALPGGWVSGAGFSNVRRYGVWWSPTDGNPRNVAILWDRETVGGGDISKTSLLSVRCVYGAD